MYLYNVQDIDDGEEHRAIMTKTFAENIKKMRLRGKLTQERLAEIAGINAKYLGEIERGEKNPTALVVYKLAHALRVPICELLPINACPRGGSAADAELSKLFAGREEKSVRKALSILKIFFAD